MTEEMAVVPAPALYVPDVASALEAWNAYQNLVKSLLDDSDYSTIRGKKHRKRSGWAKLRRAFSITTTIIDHAWEDLGDSDFGFYVVVRAMFPDGRCEDGDGYCDSQEMANGNIATTRHNVRSKAITRAKNRATADLIGSGEVSAEEFIDEEVINKPRRNPAPPKHNRDSNGKLARPLEPAVLLDILNKKAGDDDTPITEGQVGLVVSKLNEVFCNEEDPDELRHAILSWWPGVESAKELTKSQASALLEWLLDKEADEGTYDLHPDAITEAYAIKREMADMAEEAEDE